MNKEETIIKKIEGTVEYKVFKYHHGTVTAVLDLLNFLGYGDTVIHIRDVKNEEVIIGGYEEDYNVYDGDFVVKDQKGTVQVFCEKEYEEFKKSCVERPEMNKQDLAQLLYDNFYIERHNTINLCGLDFTSYNCNVDISRMKVSGELCQRGQEADGDILQDVQYTKGDLCQNNQTVEGDLYINCNYVEGNIKNGAKEF